MTNYIHIVHFHTAAEFKKNWTTQNFYRKLCSLLITLPKVQDVKSSRVQLLQQSITLVNEHRTISELSSTKQVMY